VHKITTFGSYTKAMGLFSSNNKPKPAHPAEQSFREEVKVPETVAAKPHGENSSENAAIATPVATQIINTNNNTNKMSNTNTTIGAGSIIEGQLKIEGEIFIEGVVKGTIISKSKVVLGVNGRIEGDINCQEAEISGTVTGKINVKEILTLKGNATVDGDINTGKLMMESGVKFNGKCNMGSAGSAAATAANTSAAANGNALSNGNAVSSTATVASNGQ
jgi:cytoskeletal protein CcmA (bactofilin family)